MWWMLLFGRIWWNRWSMVWKKKMVDLDCDNGVVFGIIVKIKK